ncbi:targeting protein for Xklp2 isoform X3 [Biomphalaria pfeifferi]|uniref:Targeting protein for Xklp2 isoform X3 n=1 Tax=Biomphalaria pfeifferi TaxID=112525 RepID=A0AAD8BCI6_BIOPF|nr:targeting protein for Xklp2 isoform X3 [Biomphalaria pfeifferi]
MDNKWEFDAPQFIDFTQPDAYEPFYDDSWFDRHTEADDFRIQGKPQRVVKGTAPVRSTDKNRVEMETDEKPSRNSNKKSQSAKKDGKNNPENIAENLGPSPKKRLKLSNDIPMDTEKHLGSSLTHLKAFPKDNLVSTNDDQEQNLDSPAANTRLKSHQTLQAPLESGSVGSSSLIKTQLKESVNESNNAKSLSPKKQGRSPKATKACPLTRSQSLRVKSLSKWSSTGNMKTAGLKPGSPSRLNSVQDLNKVKTSEEIELEKIALMQKETAKIRKLAQESYKKAMNADGYIPLRSKQPATMPVLFNFKTDERIKNVDGPVSEHKVKDFTKSLREALPIATLPGKPAIQGLTKPQPFHLHTQKSNNASHQAVKYESVAERVAAFHNKTPDRFRSKPNSSKERSRSATKSKPSSADKRIRSQSPKLTIPKTPNLTTRGRSRPVNIPTAEEKELMEFEEHKKQLFKAHPINHKILEATQLGVPKVAPKPPTVAEEFNFHYKKSVSVGDLRNTTTLSQEEEKFEFHAKPVNPKILQGPVGIKPVEPQPITIPQSPAFALRSRIRLPVEVPKQEETQSTIKANPVPFNGVPFRPKLAHSVTIPEPFQVEERSREMLTKREQKIQQILEEERRAREFHATNLPSDSPDTLPPKQPRPPTQPEPFHLHIDERGEKYKQQFKAKQMEEEEKAAVEAANFKAGPNAVIHKEPFQPQKSSKPLTEISEFDLNTEQRAAQREVFDQRTKAHEAYLEAVKRQKEEEREREEKAAVARMRQEAVHKATGIKKYKAVVLKPSDKPLTEAKSPKFSQRLRSRFENTQNSDV